MQDDCFIRGSLPMTKNEVRAVSLSKLELVQDAVFWDIGSGTGSVAVEAAWHFQQMGIHGGTVYAIEKEAEGIELIQRNKNKLVPNFPAFYLIKGRAPEVLAGLPAPSHVFIGGSGGVLKEIIKTVLEKNPKARIVLNITALETLSNCMQMIQTFPDLQHEIVQVAVTRLEKTGRVHLGRAMNPVYVVLLNGTC